ncbi:hypothetical protein RBB78_04010 [Tunturiibacter empetritectus]|uniref:hypothetical protein n=1 Tax=Tunturiibacter empetritectus TaxID=3069691 RepID=UPI003D9BB072
MAENVMEVAGNAFAFGDGCQCDIFFLRLAELALGASLFGEEDVAAPDEEEKKDSNKDIGPADVKEVATGVEEITFSNDEERFDEEE